MVTLVSIAKAVLVPVAKVTLQSLIVVVPPFMSATTKVLAGEVRDV